MSRPGGLATAEVDDRGAPALVRRRRPLPGGRAVVGGLLVAAAAVGVFAAYADATAGPRDRYVVAARDLAPGARLTGADLALRPIDLPAPLSGRAFRDEGSLVGAMVVGPVAAGELVQAGAVVRPEGGAGTREVSFAVPRARALGGRLAGGERVDVVATYGTGAEAVTVSVVRGALVVGVDAGRGPLGEQGDVVLTLAVDRAVDAMAVAHAARAGEVAVVRATGADADAGPDSYRPPAGDEDGS